MSNYKAAHKDGYLILKGLYDAGALYGSTGLGAGEVGGTVALSPHESSAAAAQLERAGLVERTRDATLRLSEEGLRTAERVLRQPLSATDYYPDVTDFDDREKGTRSMEEVDAVLVHLRQLLPKLKLESAPRTELEGKIEKLENELRIQSPRRSVVLSGLFSIRESLTQAAEGDGIVVLSQVTRLIDAPANPPRASSRSA